MIEWMVNTSPIIALSCIGLLDCLQSLIPGFRTPSGVVDEINAGPWVLS